MPAKSQAQHGFMGLVHAVKSGAKKLKDVPAGVRKKVGKAASSMSLDQVRDFTKTKASRLPRKVGRGTPIRRARSA